MNSVIPDPAPRDDARDLADEPLDEDVIDKWLADNEPEPEDVPW